MTENKRRFEVSSAIVSNDGKTLTPNMFGGDAFVEDVAELFKSFAGKEIHIVVQEL